MTELVRQLQADGATREKARRFAKAAKPRAVRGRPKNFVFRYQPKEKSFSLSLQFKKAQVPREELIRTLQAILEELSKQD
jgi:hypothetical protein